MTATDILETLQEIQQYLDDRSDADHNGISYVPNKAMRLSMALDDVLVAIKD
jgi:hypothetical protein